MAKGVQIRPRGHDDAKLLGFRIAFAATLTPLVRAKGGRAAANGVKLGRKPNLTPHLGQEAKRRVKARKDSIGEIARSYNVSRWTIQRLATNHAK